MTGSDPEYISSFSEVPISRAWHFKEGEGFCLRIKSLSNKKLRAVLRRTMQTPFPKEGFHPNPNSRRFPPEA